MFDRFTDRARRVLGLARRAAQEEATGSIGTEHVLLGLLEEGAGVAANVLRNLDVTPGAIRRQVEAVRADREPACTLGQLPFTPRTKLVLGHAADESRRLCHDDVGTEHLLLGLLRVEESVAGRALTQLGLRLDEVREEVCELLGADVTASGPPPPADRSGKKTKTPAIDAFTADLVERARDRALAPPVERPAELRALLTALGRRTQANALLVGPEGAGRRALVRALAHALARGEVPLRLRGARLVELDVPLLVAGTRYRGQLEERIEAVCVEARRAGGVILVLDDLAAALPRAEPDAAKPGDADEDDHRVFPYLAAALEAGDLRCVARLRADDHARRVAGDPALTRLFDVVRVAPLAGADLEGVLRGAQDGLERFHGVRIADEALLLAGDVPAPVWPGLAQPARGLKALDAACARAAWTEPTPAPRVAELDREIARLQREKEEAASRQQFEDAARCRDRVDDARRRREQALEEERRRRPPAAVGLEQVSEVVAEELVEALSGPPARGPRPERPSRFERLQVRSLLPEAEPFADLGEALVLLPASPLALRIYEDAVAPALRDRDLRPVRLDDPYRPGGALAETWRRLQGAELVVADAAGRDPGVACALGLALALERCPLLLVHDPGDLPAAFRSLRSVPYDPLDPAALRQRLASAVENFLAQARAAGA